MPQITTALALFFIVSVVKSFFYERHQEQVRNSRQ